MSESVWNEQIDKALMGFIQSKISVNGKPLKVKVRRPDEDFYNEDYPLATIQNLFSKFSKERYFPEPINLYRKDNEGTVVQEASALPYDMYYQIDFWATLQTDMNSIIKQWFNAVGRCFNLSVQDESGNSRSSFVLPRNDFQKSDLVAEGKRLFHNSSTYRIYTEIDENIQEEVPYVAYRPDVEVSGS